MGILKNNKGTIISELFTVAESFAMFKKGTMVDVNLYETELKITLKDNTVTLPYSKITNVVYDLQTSIIEKDKSSIGRALAGGALFGPAGAVVGAVSGSGKKEKKINKFMLIISYIGNDGNECFIILEDVRLWKGQKLSNKLKELCGLSEPQMPKNVTL